MADIDMIPRSYRDRVRVRAALRVTLVAMALTVAAGAAGSALLRWRTSVADSTSAQREAAAASAQGNAARNEALRLQQEQSEQAAAVLRTLRRDGELARFAQGLDAALTEQAWLTDLAVERDIQQLAPGTAAPVPPVATKTEQDLVIAVPASAGKPAATQTWHLASTVQLGGQAVSLAAVSEFLARLGQQPGVADLVLAGTTSEPSTGLVSFRAQATLIRKTQP